jgi:tRNA nucleotidyltransferase (CCA-adding enzyme)
MADIKAHSPDTQASRIERCKALEVLLTKEQEHCFSLKDLAIGGRDVIALGVPEGKWVGDILNKLLSAVINGEIPNERTILMEKVVEEIHD